jgi:hypothetical protein
MMTGGDIIISLTARGPQSKNSAAIYEAYAVVLLKSAFCSVYFSHLEIIYGVQTFPYHFQQMVALRLYQTLLCSSL